MSSFIKELQDSSGFALGMTCVKFLILAELFSLFGWILPQFNTAAFFVILFITLILTLHKLEYGLYILFAELFIGSKGYLFSLEFGETLVSIRIGLFLVVMGVFLVNVILRRTPSEVQGDDEESRGSSNNILNRICGNFYGIPRPVMLIGLGMTTVLAWAFVWGLIRGNGFANVFLDFNNWLYFLMILPIYYCLNNAQSNSKLSMSLSRNNAEQYAEQRGSFLENVFIKNILTIFITSVIWLGIKSLILLYIFSHQFVWALPEVYKWVRDTGIGEVTPIGAGNGFYRVFLQSQIFSLLAFFILLPITNYQLPITRKNKKIFTPYSLILIPCLATVILSFSRSYWVAFIITLLFYYFIILIRPKGLSYKFPFYIRPKGLSYKKFIDIFKSFGKVLIVGVIAFAIVFGVINLPPRVIEGDLVSMLGKRAIELEAAGASRINQLKPLVLAIVKHPLIGSGFGATVTYITDDPRIVPETAGGTGEFTTYAFEWGYLDMVLKFGLVGLAIYLILIYQIIRRLLISNFKFLISNKIQNSNFQNKNNYKLLITNYQLQFGFALALIALLVVNIFSPYLNHPLGIGFIIISFLLSFRPERLERSERSGVEESLKLG